ncbi:enah/Vasp-like a isoform X2 [Engraulis encrasicolus]|uniref:enah/Vasp-like a isoform X2 n=1 Tax=Engraulis encrasicolus TaxID=184585 RepID=UPI002FD352C3
MYSLDDYGEQSICQARASVMVYDDSSKKWVPIKPGQQGFSRINIYQNTANNTFRVVGVKLQDQQVVINYSIVKGLKYNQATPTFHQWRDARQVYGLNFASKEEATTFSNAMLFALNVLSTQDAGPAAHRQNGPVTDDTDLQRRQMMEQHQMHAQMERERRAGSAVSTLQFKVSGASPSQAESANNIPPDYKQYRANTLPPAYMRAGGGASSHSPPSSSSSCSPQERDGGGGGGGSGCQACDSPHRSSSSKAQQQLSQLSTTLASAFMPVQPAGVMTTGRKVRQIPLSPPTGRHLPPQLPPQFQQQQQEVASIHHPHPLPPKHGTWSASHAAAHMFAPLPASASPPGMVAGMAGGQQGGGVKQVCPQPVLPVALPLPPLNGNGRGGGSGKVASSPHEAHQLINGQPDDYYPQQQQQQHHQTPPPPPPAPQLSSYAPCCPEGQFPSPSGFIQQQQMYPGYSATSPPTYSLQEGGLPKTTPSPVFQPSPPIMSPPLPPGHPAMGQQQQQQQQHPSAVPMPVPAPVAPPPAPMVPMAPVAPPPPPGPPPPSVGPPPTPPPPPLPAGGGLGGPNQGGAPAGLAAALAGAKLRKVQRPEEGSGASGGKSDGSRSSGGSGSSGEGLMQEMNALLARRRKASEKPDEDSQKEETNGSPSPITRDPSKKPWDRANSSDKTATLSRVKAGTSSDADSEYDRMKQEILEEVVRELHKVKDEIIDAIRREVMRLSST